MKQLRVLLAGLTTLVFAFAQMTSAGLTNRYVVKDNLNAAEPYDAWTNAASNIQAAIDYAYAGETVLVASATYDTGGVITNYAGGILTNRVAIWKAITVQSASNDPTTTIIKGNWDPATNGPAAVRCVYMVAGSQLTGFTLTNGATLTTNESATAADRYGGGVWGPNAGATVIISNCVITGNSATDGGGAYGSKISMYNCVIRGNRSSGDAGGAHYGNFYNCTLANNTAAKNCGGARESILYNCTIVSNSARQGNGGGGNGGSCYNCLIIGNSAANGGRGGGAYACNLYNCTVINNSSSGGASGGGGTYLGTMRNCIVYFNSHTSLSNYAGGAFTNSCTAPDPGGVDNITADPMLVDTNTANYRLSASSPCINAGMYFSWMTDAADTRSKDLDGQKRIQYDIVDMGAYERLNAGTIFIGR